MRDMVCKGICIRHKAHKPVGEGRYATGQKRCQVCEIFVNWNGLWCPCCGYRLRSKPRNLKFKTKLRENKNPDDERQEESPTKAQSQQLAAIRLTHKRL
jgi:hypothetical protein